MTALEKNMNYTALERKIALGLFAVLWIFLFIRAIYVPVLHDEIATFFYYIQSDSYLPPEAHWDANNHVLNSMLANFSYHAFGSSPLAIRLPNVLTYALFFFAIFKIAGRLKNRLLRWSFMLALVCSHYLFEYFGECRGYGMSMAFFAMALYLFIRYTEVRNKYQILLVSLFLFLATAANLTVIIPAVLILGLLFLKTLLYDFKENKALFGWNTGFILLGGLPFFLLVKLSFAFKERGAFYYGGDSGFYDVTVRSLSEVFTDFYNTPIAVFITLLFVGFGLFLLVQLIQKKSLKVILENNGIFPFLLIANVASILFLFHQMEVNFPEDRVAMHLFLLFVASFIFILDQLGTRNEKWTYGGIILFYFPGLFIYHASPTASVFSSEERTSYPIFDYIHSADNDFKFPHLVGGYKTQEFTWYYLNNRSGGTEGKIHTNHHIALDADFQVVRDGRIKDSILFDYYKPVVNDPDTKLTLFERKKKLEKELIYTTDVRPTNGPVADEFHNILEIEIDTLQGRTIYLGTELTLDAQARPFIGQIAVTLNDSTGASLYLDYIPLDWIRKVWDGTKNNVRQGILLHHIPLEATVLKFYVWNINKTSFSIPDGKCYLYDLERDFPNQY